MWKKEVFIRKKEDGVLYWLQIYVLIQNTERCLYNNADASYNQRSSDHFFVLYNYSLRKK